MTAPYYEDDAVTLYHGDALAVLSEIPDASVNCCVTSPPYFGLRDYGVEGQYGLEESPAAYVEQLRAVFSEIRRVLADDGTCWLNIGDSYAGKANAGQALTKNRGNGHTAVGLAAQRNMLVKHAPIKSLLGIPWRVALALIDDGWTLRSDVIWSKPNPMPESVRDRPTSSHEHVFLLTKGPRYYYDADAISEEATGRDPGNGFARPEQINRGGSGEGAPWIARPQLRRALEIARDKGLTDEHFTAIKAIGMNDAGKARVNQDGTGKNDPEMQRLADEAKVALGGYFREFLTGAKRNVRDVWSIPVVGFSEAHFAAMAPALATRCVAAGCRPGGTVLDPFSGSGTTGMVAARLGRRYVGIDISTNYLDLSLRTRLAQGGLLDGEATA